MLLTAFTTNAFSQGVLFDWVISQGSQYHDFGYSLTIDNSGNLICTGTFWETVDFDPSDEEFYLTSNGFGDIYIQKLDSSGALLWVKQIGGNNKDFGYSITTDAQENIYVTGAFHGTIDFDPGPGVTYLYNGDYTEDVFVLKLNASGNFIWAMNFENYNDGCQAYEIDTDAEGNVYVTGFFSGAVDFGSDINLIYSNGLSDIFLLKLDTNGDFMWAKKMGGNNYDYGRSLTIDNNANIYITGRFNGAAEFPSFTYPDTILTSAGDLDIFIQKLDSNGHLVWLKQIGNEGADSGNAIAVDVNGNVYSTGIFSGLVDFDPNENVANMSSLGDNDIYIQKLDSNGQFLWARKFGDSIDNETVRSVYLDFEGDVYITGGINGYNNSMDIFVRKLTSNGDLVWHKTIGHHYNDIGYSIVTDQLKNVYLTGYYQADVDFNIGTGITNEFSEGATDIFILKLKQCTPYYAVDSVVAIESYVWKNGYTYTEDNSSAVYTQINYNTCDSIFTLNLKILPVPEVEIPLVTNIYPNPGYTNITIELDSNDQYTQILIYDVLGKIIENITTLSETKIQLSLVEYQKGIYFIQFISDEKKKTIKFLKL